MYNLEAKEKEIKKSKQFKGKYYVKYVYLDDSGDHRPYYDWEEETYETIEELGKWVARCVESDSDFGIVEIKKLVDFDDEEYNEYTVAVSNELLKIKEKRKAQEKRALREWEERKKEEEDERFQLYLKLKEKYENN